MHAYFLPIGVASMPRRSVRRLCSIYHTYILKLCFQNCFRDRIYIITPLTRINGDDEPSGYAEIPDHRIFL